MFFYLHLKLALFLTWWNVYNGSTSKSRQVHLYASSVSSGFTGPISASVFSPVPVCLRTHPAPGCLVAFPRPGCRAGGWGPHRCTHVHPGSQTLSPSIWSHSEVSENTEKEKKHTQRNTHENRSSKESVHFNSPYFVFPHDVWRATLWLVNLLLCFSPSSIQRWGWW